MNAITPAGLLALQAGSAEWALFDIREAGEADQGHIFGASFLPRRLIEARIADLVGNRATTIVLTDEGGARAGRAAATLDRLGYRDVRVLAGGTAAWVADGQRLTSGSNVPSKLFGEEVYEHEHVPQLPVHALKGWQDRDVPHMVCDIRTPDEYVVARIPGAHGAFGVDLALVAGDLRAKGMPIVVHCAGRTRSIIACQTLRALGVKEVYALENGTMGWQVAGHELERGTPRGELQATASSVSDGAARTRTLALAAGASEVSPEQVEAWLAERATGGSNTYFIDVRQLDAYVAGHIAGAIALPGGLAIQRTDEFAPVRVARVVLIDDGTARAFLTAYWLCKAGRPDVAVLGGGLNDWKASGRALESGRERKRPAGMDEARRAVNTVSPAALAALPKAQVVDVGTSRDFARARVPGARWIPYGWLEERIDAVVRDAGVPLVLTCPNGALSLFAAANLQRTGHTDVRVLDGGAAAWAKAGHPVDKGWPDALPQADDLVVPPYQANLEAMARYLDWEQKLTAGRRTGAGTPAAVPR